MCDNLPNFALSQYQNETNSKFIVIKRKCITVLKTSVYVIKEI